MKSLSIPGSCTLKTSFKLHYKGNKSDASDFKDNLLNLINFLGRFKDLKRSGWLARKVSSPESDAEHSFSLAFQALLLTPSYLDRCRCIELALAHDIAEVYSGDMLPGEINAAEKHQKEREAVCRLSKELNAPTLIELFDEYENQETPESRFIKSLDKLDNVLLAHYYDACHRAPQPLFEEFSNGAKKYLKDHPQKENETAVNIIKILEQ